MDEAIIFGAELKKSLNPVVFLLVITDEAHQLQKIQSYGLDHHRLWWTEDSLTELRIC